MLDELRKEGHISDLVFAQTHCFLEDMRVHQGTSNGLVGEMTERVQTSLNVRAALKARGKLDAYERTNKVLEALHKHERDVLTFLIIHRVLPRGTFTDWGRQKSGYEHGRSACAFTTGRISGLLNSIAELYPVTG